MMQGQGERGRDGQTRSAECPPPTTRSARSTWSARSASSTTFTRDLQGCERCPRGNLMPVLGSGHPQADVFLLKYAPDAVGDRGGRRVLRPLRDSALMKSLRRLDIDPLAVYGTLCVKCPVADTSLAAPECLARLVEEIAIVQPKIVVVMGAEALATLNELALPLARTVEDRPGEVQTLTPSIEALVVPDIDDCARRGGRQARVLDAPSARSAPGGRTSLRTEVASPAERGGRMLSVKDVVVRFGGVVALDGPTFEVARRRDLRADRARTAPARPRCSTASAGSRAPTRARSRSRARTCSRARRTRSRRWGSRARSRTSGSRTR